MNVNVVNAFAREFDACLTCLEQTVKMVSDEDWVAGETNRQKPVHQACHCLMGPIKYAKAPVSYSSICFKFKDPPRKYPTRQHVLELIAKTRPALRDYIEGVVERTLVDRKSHVPAMFKMIYLLRHTIVHLSSLREELHHRGYRLPVYSKRYRPGSA